MVSMLTLFRCFTDGCAAFDGTPLQVQPECVRIHQNAYEINCKWTIHIILGEMNRVRIWGIRMLPYGSMPTVWEATPYINLNHSPAVLRMYGWIHRVRVWPSLTPQKHPKKKKLELLHSLGTPPGQDIPHRSVSYATTAGDSSSATSWSLCSPRTHWSSKCCEKWVEIGWRTWRLDICFDDTPCFS